jgi:hypothetical protein
MNAYEANENRLLSEVELDKVAGGHPAVAMGDRHRRRNR